MIVAGDMNAEPDSEEIALAGCPQYGAYGIVVRQIDAAPDICPFHQAFAVQSFGKYEGQHEFDPDGDLLAVGDAVCTRFTLSGTSWGPSLK